MRRTDLALRALRLLERTGGTLRSAELAEHLGTTATFVPQVMSPLVRGGWLGSGTGPKGGYQLVGNLGEYSVLELIELIEGPTDTGRCVLRGGGCPETNVCSLHDAWVVARGALIERLRRTPVSALEPTDKE
jgi:Rrf2 family transcriptional regulator, iron-sulfur cluster assembly transcription factor